MDCGRIRCDIRELPKGGCYLAAYEVKVLKIVAMSDTHGMHRQVKVPEGDVLIHAGDLTGHGQTYQYIDFFEWMSSQPHKYKILVAGNHDWAFHDEKFCKYSLIEQYDIIYLQDEWLEIDGIKFHGSPWQPEFCNWAFNLPRGERLAEKWAMIPEDTDVLITHGPPCGCCDLTAGMLRVGCVDLYNRIREVEPRYHICGHIHEGYGRTDSGPTSIINASVCTAKYEPTNEPVVFEV